MGYADQVKQVQRSGDKGKQAWIEYCDESLGGVRDPNRHDGPTLKAFLDWWHSQEGGAEDEDYDLADEVKNVQRSGPQGKEAWAAYCTEHLGGIADPKRHDAATLQEFLSWWQSGEHYTEAGRHDSVQASAPPAHLVEQIKDLQRTNPDAKERWGEFCDSTPGGFRDPGRHDAATLRNFLRRYAPGASRQGSHVPHAPQAPQSKPGGSAATPADFIKQGAKLSKEFKAAWVAYCKRGGASVSDPSKVSQDFLVEFADYVAGLVQFDIGAVPTPEPAKEPLKQPPSLASKRPPATTDSNTAPAKKKLTIRKSVADEIRRINAEDGLQEPIRIPAVASALAPLSEDEALNVLSALYDSAGSLIAGDPNHFIVMQAAEVRS